MLRHVHRKEPGAQRVERRQEGDGEGQPSGAKCNRRPGTREARTAQPNESGCIQEPATEKENSDQRIPAPCTEKRGTVCEGIRGAGAGQKRYASRLPYAQTAQMHRFTMSRGIAAAMMSSREPPLKTMPDMARNRLGSAALAMPIEDGSSRCARRAAKRPASAAPKASTLNIRSSLELLAAQAHCVSS